MAAALSVRRPRLGPLVSIVGLVAWAIVALAPSPAIAADPFYLDLLREGGLAYDRGDAARAARTLKLACFGLLEEPKLVGECLARLALAEDKSGDAEGFREAFRRLCEVEDRFGGYSQASPGLPPALRAQLEKRVASLPAATLEQSPPAFRTLIPAKAAEATAGSRRPKPKAEAPPSAPVQKPAAAGPATPRTGSAVAAGDPPAPPSPGAPAAVARGLPPVKGLSADDRGKLGQVRRTLDQQGDLRDLSQAFDLARAVADAHPEAADAQRLAGEAAYRIKRFKEAAEYFRRGGDPGDGEPELLFYQAVSLFELGNKDEAAAAFKRALPNLRRTPYIDGYAKKILGP
jgi:hypothetical protein